MRNIQTTIFCRPKYDEDNQFPLESHPKPRANMPMSEKERTALGVLNTRLIHGGLNVNDREHTFFHQAVFSNHENAIKIIRFFIKQGVDTKKIYNE